MEITQTFGSTFSYMLRAKMRNFARRSWYRYAAGIALVTYGIHRADPSLSNFDKLSHGVLYFALLCIFVFLVYCVYAAVQSRRFPVRTVTFTDTTITVVQDGNATTRDWDWVISADESSTIISMLIHQSPRTEGYLPKHKIGETDFHTFRNWLVSNGKLASNTDA